MRALNLLHSNILILNSSKSKLLYLNQINRLLSSVTNEKTTLFKSDKSNQSIFSVSYNQKFLLQPFDKSILTRLLSTESQQVKSEQEPKPNAKKQSKFKQFYTQYGPMFLVVHLTTVVMWIYGFYLISKQGYDITQLLNIFHSLNIMAKSTVDSIHEKIDNYKMESGWITGQNLKHFATAYMIYKVIAPFRYMVSIGIVRFIVKNLRSKGLIKS